MASLQSPEEALRMASAVVRVKALATRVHHRAANQAHEGVD